MLELVPPEPAHQKSVHDTTLGPICLSNIINKLDLTVLVYDVRRHNATSSTKAASIRKLDLRSVFALFGSVVDQVTNVRIEHIEDEPTPSLQMAVNALERRDLIARRNQMLKGTKWYQYDTKSFIAQIELAHV